VTCAWEEAVRRGDAQALEAMLGAGAPIDAKDQHGQTALMVAAHRGHGEVVSLLVRHGAALDHTAKYSLTALMLAIIAGHPAIVRALAEAGANQAIRGSGLMGFAGKTALDLARARGDAEMVAALEWGRE